MLSKEKGQTQRMQERTQERAQEFRGQQVGDCIPDTFSPDHCMVTVRVSWCSFCKETSHTRASCKKIFCSACKKRGHVVQECTLKCTGCKKVGHTRQECKSSPCVHCGGAHRYKDSKKSTIPSCPVIQLAKQGASIERIVSFIQEDKEFFQKDDDSYGQFIGDTASALKQYSESPLSQIKEAKTLLLGRYSVAIRKFFQDVFKSSPETLLASFVQRVQPFIVVSKSHYFYPESHKFRSTVPGISEGDYLQPFVHCGSIHTIQARQAYKAQPSIKETLALVFLGYAFYVEPALSEGRGYPQGA